MYVGFDTNSSYPRSLPLGGNMLNYSMLSEFYSPVRFRGFSIKYVVEGTEQYTVNGRVYPLQRGKYLLANAFCEGHVKIEGKSKAKGICIDVSSALLSEVVATHLQPGSGQPDPALDRFFATPAFLENMYHAASTELGRCLGMLEKQLADNPFGRHNFSDEFYFGLCEKIVADHLGIFKQLNAVQALKASTRKDLFRKLQRGKEYMDHCFSGAVSITQVARESSLSEYHFFRLFKSVYGITPHRYLLNKKMERAHLLLKKGNDTVSTVSAQLGFADVFTFSKSFKKHFGISPSGISKGI